MKKYYKLTDKNGQTQNSTKWGENVKNEVEGELKECKNGIHAYSSPLLAVLHNPIHSNFDLSSALLWECAASKECIDDNGMKSCHRWVRTLKQIPIPEVTTTQKVAYGILCALEVYQEESFIKWAKNWLSGEDRSYGAAYAAYAVARAAAVAAVAAAYAADAAYAAHAAAYAGAAADAAYAAHAAHAADAAACAAAAKTGAKLDLVKIAEKAMTIK